MPGVAAGQESPTVDEPNGGAAVQLSFWQHPFVVNILPFLTSLSLHLAIIIFGWLSYKVIEKVALKVRNQVIIPESVIAPEGQEGGVPHPGLGGDPTRDAAQDKFPDVPASAEGISDKQSKDLTQTLAGGGSADSVSDGVIGLGPNTGFGKGHGGGPGQGDGSGNGSGDGGALAPFGVPGGGGGIGPRSNFVGVGGNAKKVAFICDASGSMMQKFDPLRIELRKAVDGLRPPQSFQIIFFQETSCLAADMHGLLFASPDNKRKAYDFVDKTAPRGSTDPIPALQMAFKQGSELIYLLTDGDFPDNKAVLAELKKLNPEKKVHINTIAFLEHEGEYEKVLKGIADDNGGIFRFVSEDDLNK